MPLSSGIRAVFWMTAALVAEAALLPHWIPVRWIPQISFLILLFVSLRHGMKTGFVTGLWLGAGHSLFSAMPPGELIWIYAALGTVAGASKNFIFLESPLAQWLAPVGFGLLAEAVFFFKMPWDDAPFGFGDFAAMIRASNLPVTWILSGFVYFWLDRRLRPRKKT